ncbi:MAG: hypothetical protein M1374_02105 [Firmicutes bacterium]|nr:hypothetical protein [Bacillota bacterium]
MGALSLEVSSTSAPLALSNFSGNTLVIRMRPPMRMHGLSSYIRMKNDVTLSERKGVAPSTRWRAPRHRRRDRTESIPTGRFVEGGGNDGMVVPDCLM